jgi:hypothetical protein
MTKEEFINNWIFDLDNKEDAIKMMADLDKVISNANKTIINHIGTCNFYQPDNTTAMNCLHCGRGKYLHKPNPLYP